MPCPFCGTKENTCVCTFSFAPARSEPSAAPAGAAPTHGASPAPAPEPEVEIGTPEPGGGSRHNGAAAVPPRLHLPRAGRSRSTFGGAIRTARPGGQGALRARRPLDRAEWLRPCHPHFFLAVRGSRADGEAAPPLCLHPRQGQAPHPPGPPRLPQGRPVAVHPDGRYPPRRACPICRPHQWPRR